ncbi:TetR/AcrR family transcriptional regulator [Antrihabitans cavernicola]|uniref:TetR/AcrR family transcriptional regulator n=1 Tax=Antrihabitans cavernicola TaxID=2495913 RepID=A0A5A7SJ86_9NOCA|nr:TetR/AcrR family transcriptional regulator [Spelaeibacter cavernicola]KAA0024311.1 TetR/AcrR family transcriptional regulator [Spelaeibacter cavernicola]
MPYRRTSAIQERLDAKQSAILRAATTLLAERGYQGLSMASVAAAAGIATGSVYSHFADKSALVTAIFRVAVDRELTAVTDAASQSATQAERVTAIVETFAGRAMKNPKLAYALLAEPVDAEVEAERLIFRRTFAEIFEGAIAGGIAAGRIVPQDPRVTAAALVGAIAEVLIGPLSARPYSDSVIPELVAFTLRSLGVAGVDPQR